MKNIFKILGLTFVSLPLWAGPNDLPLPASDQNPAIPVLQALRHLSKNSDYERFLKITDRTIDSTYKKNFYPNGQRMNTELTLIGTLELPGYFYEGPFSNVPNIPCGTATFVYRFGMYLKPDQTELDIKVEDDEFCQKWLDRTTGEMFRPPSHDRREPSR